jgi:hypothetical protein
MIVLLLFYGSSTARRARTTSHRVIPLNTSAIGAAARMFERADLLGQPILLQPRCGRILNVPATGQQ